MNDKVSKWYENTKNVDEMLDWRPTLKEWEKSVSKLFSPGSRILDIGCGLGREAFALHDLGFEVVGIDISKEVISRVKQLSADKGSSSNSLFMFYDLILPDEKIDHIASFNVDGTESSGAIEFTMKMMIHDRDRDLEIYNAFVER